MNIQLPEDLQRYIDSEVQSGHFASEQDAIEKAVRLLRQRQPSTEHETLEEEVLDQQLLKAGILGSVPSRLSVPGPEFQPITITGEPLSETVIRERR